MRYKTNTPPQKNLDVDEMCNKIYFSPIIFAIYHFKKIQKAITKKIGP